MDSPTTPRKRRKDARPTELLAAALDLFVEKGYSATRLEDVAARAGASKGTLYLYFANKEALFKAVIEEGIIPVIAENEAIAAEHTGSAFALMERLIYNWWEKIGQTAYSGIPKLMVAEARNFPELAQFYYEKVILRARALGTQALQYGMRSGEFRTVDLDTALDVIIAPIIMLLILRHSLYGGPEHGPDPSSYLKTHLQLLAHGLLKLDKETQV